MFCASCGKQNDAGYKFCASCGESLQPATPPPSPPPPSTSPTTPLGGGPSAPVSPPA
ncbi:MAG: zinc-ribbon domain-containing protein, partial [Proteobacteria bacterium]|nr:zinc-ribbon domain-containing protein [Pseudomonadota bacterium]